MKRRNTKQKQIVLDVVRNRYDHPTAGQIYEDVCKVDPNISLATVYRNLLILVEEKQIREIELDGADRYDLTVDKHNHFECERCGRLFDIEIDYDHKLDNIKTENGFFITSHQTIYSGLCPDCQKENQN